MSEQTKKNIYIYIYTYIHFCYGYEIKGDTECVPQVITIRSSSVVFSPLANYTDRANYNSQCTQKFVVSTWREDTRKH
jgi:hypothetical protein